MSSDSLSIRKFPAPPTCYPKRLRIKKCVALAAVDPPEPLESSCRNYQRGAFFNGSRGRGIFSLVRLLRQLGATLQGFHPFAPEMDVVGARG